MKQILLMIAVVALVGCANDDRAKRLEEENRRLKAELESLKSAKMDFKIAGTYRSTKKISASSSPTARPITSLGGPIANPVRGRPRAEVESWDTMEYRMLHFSESGATADNVVRGLMINDLNHPPTFEWKLKDEELHADFGTGTIEIFEINRDASLTRVGFFFEQPITKIGENPILVRHNLSEEVRETFIKVK
jgi:hypothetical protein